MNEGAGLGCTKPLQQSPLRKRRFQEGIGLGAHDDELCETFCVDFASNYVHHFTRYFMHNLLRCERPSGLYLNTLAQYGLIVKEFSMDTMTMKRKSERLSISVPLDLARMINHWAEELNVKLSDLARIALSEKVAQLEREKLEKELEAGYKANTNYYARMSEEWTFADSI